MALLRYYKKTVYGIERNYPYDYKSPLFTLTGRLTLNDKDLEALKEMGFEVLEIDTLLKEIK